MPSARNNWLTGNRRPKQTHSKINMAKKKKRKIDLMFITACISTSLVLLLIGAIAFLILSANEVSKKLRQEMVVEVVLEDAITDTQANDLIRMVKAARYTSSQTFISKSDALAEMTQAMGTDPTEFVSYNPFYASVNIRLKPEYANNDSLAWIEKELTSVIGVKETNYQRELLGIVNENITKVSLALFALACILAMISFALINNTIKLTIYAQRFTLYSMKLVGAKWSFIRRPFILKNMCIGIVSAIITCGLFWVGLTQGVKHEPWLSVLMEPQIMWLVFGIVTVVGLIITSFCALHSVNRFLRMKSGELHYI